jgi:hypothetical protein
LVISIMGSVAGGDSLRIGGAARGVDFLVAFLAPTFLDGGRGISAAAATACSTAACLLGGGGGVELGVAKGDDDDDDAVVVCVW